MALEFEIAGNIAREDVQQLRRALEGVQVALSSGFSGERILKIVGELTKAQLAMLREFLLRLLGDDRISGIKITRDAIEIGNVSGKNLEAAKAAVAELATLIAQSK